MIPAFSARMAITCMPCFGERKQPADGHYFYFGKPVVIVGEDCFKHDGQITYSWALNPEFLKKAKVPHEVDFSKWTDAERKQADERVHGARRRAAIAAEQQRQREMTERIEHIKRHLSREDGEFIDDLWQRAEDYY